MEYTTKTYQKTQKVGQEIGASLAGGIVLALTGDLGSGKTTFMQGLARGLGFEKNLNSPTFIIVRKYQIINHKLQTTPQATQAGGQARIESLYHVDLYRLEGNIKEELENLGLFEEMGKPENVVAIEWAEKAKDFLPDNTKWVEFESLSDSERKIVVR